MFSFLGRSKNVVVPHVVVVHHKQVSVSFEYEYSLEILGIDDTTIPAEGTRVATVVCTTQQGLPVPTNDTEKEQQLMECAQKQVPVDITITWSCRHDKSKRFPQTDVTQVKSKGTWPSATVVETYKKNMNEAAIAHMFQRTVVEEDRAM